FLEHFLWTLAAYALIRYTNTEQHKYLYGLAVALVLGWWSKYSVLFFVGAFFIALLLSPQRKMLAQKQFWLAVALGVVLILPNVLWQYFHNWPLAHHMAELRDTQLKYINRADFLKEQLLMLLPVAFVWIGGLIWLLRKPRYRIIGLMYLGVVLLLMLGSGKGYYTLGAYPMLLAAGGVCYERMGFLKSWVRYASVALILLLSFPFIPLLLPMQAPPQMAEMNRQWGLQKLGVLNWEDQKAHPLQQDFADMLGWKELTEKTENTYNNLSTFSKAHTYIFCGSYGQAGALQYYGKSAAFRSRVISANGTFLLWMPLPLQFDNLIFVDEDPPEHPLFQHFEKATLVDSVSNPLSRQYGDGIYLFQHADSLAAPMANAALSKLKAVFTRP
ncbi:MAG TPA: glycosyltransferase family 39 protein, partial [Chitinophagaceae bacterium]|nr:glycosyltransferase family 39 protein [Chitinophagaceae bacterium]